MILGKVDTRLNKLYNLPVKFANFIADVFEIDDDTRCQLIYSYKSLYFKMLWMIGLIFLSMSIYMIFETTIFLEVVVFMVVFINLRSRFGGFHFKNETICIVISILIPIVCSTIAVKYNFYLKILVIVYFIAFMLAISIGTIDNENKRLKYEKKKKFKKDGIKKLTIFFIINLIIYQFYKELGQMVNYNILQISNVIILSVIVSLGNPIIAKKLDKQQER